MAAPKIELLSKKLTKPSSSTPHHLRTYKLSFLDQLQCLKYLPTTLFYANNSSNNASNIYHQPSSFEYIEKALADVLSFYYPYAGTLANNVSIDCNDTGVMFTEVRIHCSIFQFLKQPCLLDQNLLYCNEYLPWKDHGKEECLAAAQLSHFECGGKAISFCQTHKVGDATTLCNFLNGWAAMARSGLGRGGVDQLLLAPPPLIGASLMPPDEDQVASDTYDRGIKPGIVSRRFRFDASKISHLRAKIAAESDVKNPTRFEAVTTLLNRCVSLSSSPFKPFAIYCPVNNRKLTTPPLPSNLVGNFGAPIVLIISKQQDLHLPILIAKLRSEKDQVYKNYNNIRPNDKDKLVSAAIEDLGKFPENMRTIITSSWLKMPFYDVDFGWGRPFKALPLPPPVEDCFILMDDRNGEGVYAIVTLHEEVMVKFEVDKELLEFACLDACF